MSVSRPRAEEVKHKSSELELLELLQQKCWWGTAGGPLVTITQHCLLATETVKNISRQFQRWLEYQCWRGRESWCRPWFESNLDKSDFSNLWEFWPRPPSLTDLRVIPSGGILNEARFGRAFGGGVVRGLALLTWATHWKKPTPKLTTGRVYKSGIQAGGVRGRPTVTWPDRVLEYIREGGCQAEMTAVQCGHGTLRPHQAG